MDRTASFLAAVSPRVRRAVGMMLLAVIVIGATSLFFLHPWQTSQRTIGTTQVKDPPAVPGGTFVRYEFLNASVGWAAEIAPDSTNAGRYWIFETLDGAKHWRKVLSGQSTRIVTTVESLHFVDARNGFVAAGDPPALYRSTDGGAHWARLELPMPDAPIPDAPILNFVDSLHGWLLAGPNPGMRPYATADGGSTWTRLPDGPSDAGVTWRLVTTPNASGASGEYVFEDARHWWMFQGLDFFKTADSGLSWTLVSRGVSTGPNQVQVLDPMHAWGQLDDGNGAQLLFTSDGGLHWKQMNVPLPQ